MNYQQLSTEERYQIYSLKKAGSSQTNITAYLSRYPVTIYQLIYTDKFSGGALYQYLRVLRKIYRKRQETL
jgi:IS30 family transposase